MLTRAVPLALAGAIAVVGGVYLLGAAAREERSIVLGYATDWQHRDYGAMWAVLTPRSRRQIGRAEFTAEMDDASQTATAWALHPVKLVAVGGHRARVSFVVYTHVFGRLHEVLEMQLSGSGGGTRVVFNTSLLFPGLRPGQLLSRRTEIGARGTLLAANGQPLAEGSSLSTPIPQVAGPVVGTIGRIPVAQATMYAEEGYPPTAKVGVDGLERVFQRRLAGRLGGQLLGGTHVLARAAPGRGATVRTTIDPSLEQDAIAALGGRYGGITVMNPHTGAIQAAAGIAWGDVQPPGSTFKIVTATAALAAGIATPSTIYPYESSVVLDGFKMENAGGEVCGGTLTNAFANSCDTTFAPLGSQLGAQRLVAMAKRFRVRSLDRDRRRGQGARSPQPTRSAGRSRSAPQRSARGSCRPARWGWRMWPQRSPTAGAGRCRRCFTGRGRASRV